MTSCQHDVMRKTQIYLDEELDTAIRDEAAFRSISRAELIRILLRERLKPAPTDTRGLDSVVGSLHIEPFDVDDAVYGSRTT